jgi:tyrosyl-tRNA synthetase
MTSNYEFYQYLYNQPDDAMKSLLYRFTLIERKVIDEIIDKHSKKPYERLAQKTLADTVTIDVRGKKALEEANQIREILFHGGLEKAPLFMMKKVIKEISNKVFLKEEQSISLIDVLVNSSICESKSQARKLIEQKSISYNGETISDINFTFSKKKVVEFIKKGNKTYIILD